MFRLVLAAAVLLLSVVPVAAGQGTPIAPEASMTSEVGDLGRDGRLTPEGELAEVKIVLSIACEVPPSPPGMTIAFSVNPDKPEYASVIMNPASTSLTQDPSDCANPSHRDLVETTALVTTTRVAPALATFGVTIEATVRGSSDEYGPFTTSFNLTNDLIPLTQIVPAFYFTKAPPGSRVSFPITMLNLGNGAVKVSTSISQPNENKLDEIIPPALVRLESRSQDGAAALYRQDVRVEARAPGGQLYTNKIFSFTANFTSRSSQADDTKIDSTVLVLSIQVQGSAVPGPSVGLLFLAAAATTLFVARRRSL